MRGQLLAGGLVLVLAFSAPVLGSAATGPAIGWDDEAGSGSARSSGYLQCVPYARQVSGIRIYGDAHTWWGQAAAQYERGYRPRVGAVIAFKPHGNMRLGHVAAVSRIVDSRTVLLRHANWSPIGGRRGQIEDNVRAVDVSPGNDWSEVRVWFDPIQALGGTHWPVHGFIYNRPATRLGDRTVLARAPKREKEAKTQLASWAKGDDEDAPPARNSREPERHQSAAKVHQAAGIADPIGQIIAARSNRTSIRTLAARD